MDLNQPQYIPLEENDYEIQYLCFDNHVIFFKTFTNLKFNSLTICELNKYDKGKKNVITYIYDEVAYPIVPNVTYGLHVISNLLVSWDHNSIEFINFTPTQYYFVSEQGFVFTDCKNLKFNEKIQKCITLFVIQYGKLWTETFYQHAITKVSYHFLKRYSI